MNTHEIQRLIDAGYGISAYSDCHKEFGSGIWKYEFNGIRLVMFEKGFSYADTSNIVLEMAYASINDIKSEMTVRMLSHAAATFTGKEMIPLNIVGQETVRLMIPMVIYSNVIKVLLGLRTKCLSFHK